MTSGAEPFDEAVVPAPALLLEGDLTHLEVAVHDASRLAWNVTVPLPGGSRVGYTFELELEVPANLAGIRDPWAALQAYARLDGGEAESARGTSVEAFRRSVAAASSRVARARDGFTRHCTLLRSSPTVEDNHWRPLRLWLEAAGVELARARSGILRSAAPREELALADEFLSMQEWAVLTDCGRAIVETRDALEARGIPVEPFEAVEATLAATLRDEMAHRRNAGFPMAEPANTAQMERLLARTRWLKRHFERVLFLDVESYEVVSRYRFDVSTLFPRLHDAVRGLASVDPRTGRVVIVDVPRNYELPLRASLRWGGRDSEELQRRVVLNKNGLVRVEEAEEESNER